MADLVRKSPDGAPRGGTVEGSPSHPVSSTATGWMSTSTSESRIQRITRCSRLRQIILGLICWRASLTGSRSTALPVPGSGAGCQDGLVDVVDLRSDTVTRPGLEMRKAMAEAEV